MNTRPLRYFSLGLIGFGALLVAQPAHAQLTQFAAALTGSNGLQFNNSGAASNLTVNPSPRILPFFAFTVADGTGLDAFTSIPAQMTLSSTALAPGGNSQLLNSITMAITARPGLVDDGNGHTFNFLGGENLLTMTTTNSIMTTTNGSSNGNVAGDTNLVTQTVSYSSAYLDFTGTTQRTFNWILNPMNVAASVNGNGYVNNFRSTGNLSFSSNPAPLPPAAAPEPGTLALAALGGLALARRRRTAK